MGATMTTGMQMMRAVFHDQYGDAGVLRLIEREVPVPADDQVLVRVRAAGVDRGVWHLMTGTPYAVRPVYGLRRPKRQPVPGMDVAGVVEAVGDKVTRFSPGDEVLGIGKGTFAELAIAPERKLVAKPANLSFEQAAALPISAIAALIAVGKEGRVQAGQRVLVTGAGGGVGHFAVQLAVHMGAEVTAVVSAGKADFVRSVGATHVIDYARDDFTDGSRQWDVIVDIAGNRPTRALRRALEPKGTLVFTGGDAGGTWTGGLGRPIRAALLSPFVGHWLRWQMPTERLTDIEAVTELAEAGHIAPAVERTYVLSEAAEALRHLERSPRGKLVIIL